MAPYTSIRGVCCLCLAILGVPFSCGHRPVAPAFINNAFSLKISSFEAGKGIQMTKETDKALFDAEEAAAIDAHDLSDPGMEGAAMERAVIMAAEYEGQHPHKEIQSKSTTSFMGRIRSLFHLEDIKADLFEVTDAEANYAHDLSDTAAMEHANEVALESSGFVVDEEKELVEAKEAAATYAHDLSDTAAMEHILTVLTPTELKNVCIDLLNGLQAHEDGWVFNTPVDPIELGLDDYFDIIKHPMDLGKVQKKLEGGCYNTFNDFHSDVQLTFDNAMKYNEVHTVVHVMAKELKKKFEADFNNLTKQDINKHTLNPKEAATAYIKDLGSYVHDLSNAAALGALPKQADEAHIASVEEYYKSIEKDIKTIEHLIEEADRLDVSEGRSPERTFADEDAAYLAFTTIEKSIVAAKEEVEFCQKIAELTEDEVKTALEEKYSAKALAKSIEHDQRAAEMRFISKENFEEDEAEVMERYQDSSILHADEELLADVHKREHDAGLKLEEAIEHDISAKRELEHMIDNKASLKHELHILEQIIHDRTLELWKKEGISKKKYEPVDKKKEHNLNWWSQFVA